VTASQPWDADSAVKACRIGPWTGDAWRFHGRRYAATSPAGSLHVSGRYHRGLDRFPADETWPALYLALRPHIALAERLRHTEPDDIPRLNSQRLSRLRISLGAVLDCCGMPDCSDLSVAGLAREDVCRRFDYRVPQELAAAARRLMVEAIIVPSCSRFNGGNLVVFTDHLRGDSAVELVDSEDPELFVSRSEEQLG